MERMSKAASSKELDARIGVTGSRRTPAETLSISSVGLPEEDKDSNSAFEATVEIMSGTFMCTVSFYNDDQYTR